MLCCFSDIVHGVIFLEFEMPSVNTATCYNVFCAFPGFIGCLVEDFPVKSLPPICIAFVASEQC